MGNSIPLIRQVCKRNKGVFLSFVIIVISIGFMLLARTRSGFAQWYASKVYPVFPALAGRFFSPWEFSVLEAGIILLILITVYKTLKIVWLLWLHPPRGKTYLLLQLRYALYIFSILLFTYTLTCSINYHRENIGDVLNLPVEDVSVQKLENLTLMLADQMIEIINDPEWHDSLRSLNDMNGIGAEAIAAMQYLGRTEPSLSGYYPKPKPLYTSKLLSAMGIEGFYSPFTMEANFNNDMTSFLVPYTMCHEFAHLKGYMREEDAGFIAYLACKESPSPIFQYSGAFHALTFSLSALKNTVPIEQYYDLYAKLPEFVQTQLSHIGQERREEPAIYRNIARTVNDVYLLANAQEQGAKSYGKMVDYLLAEYKELLEPNELL